MVSRVAVALLAAFVLATTAPPNRLASDGAAGASWRVAAQNTDGDTDNSGATAVDCFVEPSNDACATFVMSQEAADDHM
jgi:hypothetical protein